MGPGTSILPCLADRGKALFRQQDLSNGHKAIRLQTTEVHARGQIPSVELDFVIAGIDVAVDEFCHLLAECVEDHQCDM